ncbi:lipoprotein, partial [Pseudomonas lactis]
MKKILFALSALALLAACDKAPKEAPTPAPAS